MQGNCVSVLSHSLPLTILNSECASALIVQMASNSAYSWHSGHTGRRTELRYVFCGLDKNYECRLLTSHLDEHVITIQPAAHTRCMSGRRVLVLNYIPLFSGLSPVICMNVPWCRKWEAEFRSVCLIVRNEHTYESKKLCAYQYTYFISETQNIQLIKFGIGIM
jgi:hypothetical protein